MLAGPGLPHQRPEGVACVERGVVEHLVEERLERLADRATRRDAESREVIAVEGEVADGERIAPGDAQRAAIEADRGRARQTTEGRIRIRLAASPHEPRHRRPRADAEPEAEGSKDESKKDEGEKRDAAQPPRPVPRGMFYRLRLDDDAPERALRLRRGMVSADGRG